MPVALNRVMFYAAGGEAGLRQAAGRGLEACGAYQAGDFAAGATPQATRPAVRRIREWMRALKGAGVTVAGLEQHAVQAGECRGCTGIGAQPLNWLASVLSESAGPADGLLHHRRDRPAPGRVAHRCVRPQQAVLAHQAQDAQRQRRGLAHQAVGVEPCNQF